MCWHVCSEALSKTAGADDCSLGGAFELTDKSNHRVGHLNITLAKGSGNLNDFPFNSSAMVRRTQFFLEYTLLQYFCRK